MSTGARPHLKRLSIAVALRATALVAVVYLLFSVAVVAYLTGSLTAQVDQRLAVTIDHFSDAPWPVGELPERPAGDRPLGPQRAFWGVRPGGEVVTDVEELPLPAEARQITGPATLMINGTELRVMGRPSGPNHIVVGESLEPLNDARATVVLGELLIAPVLLLVVFLGAVAIGRRVAEPIERARQRQLAFTADASHELRTPLAVIEANTSLALTQRRDGTWYRHAFEQVDAEAKRMRRLLDDLLWLARFDATRERSDAEPVDVAVLAQRAVERFGPVAEARRLSLRLDTSGDDLVVAAPADWLDRLIGVLLDNACRYSPEGSAVTVAVVRDRTSVTLTVDDAGPGIPEDEASRVFDRFHRATDTAGGAGLGLAIGDAVVRGTGGQWHIGRSAHGGARMSVSWPKRLSS